MPPKRILVFKKAFSHHIEGSETIIGLDSHKSYLGSEFLIELEFGYYFQLDFNKICQRGRLFS